VSQNASIGSHDTYEGSKCISRNTQREIERVAYNGIEKSGFSNVGEANDTSLEAHAYLGRRRREPSVNVIEASTCGGKRVICEEG